MMKVLRRFAKSISLVLVATVFSFGQQPPITEKCNCPPAPSTIRYDAAFNNCDARTLRPPAPTDTAAAFYHDHDRQH